MPTDELMEVIQKIDNTGAFGIKYSQYSDSSSDLPDWNYRNYDILITPCKKIG